MAVSTSPALTPALARAALALAAEASAQDGVGALSEQARLRLAPDSPSSDPSADPSADTRPRTADTGWLHLVDVVDGELRGYAALDDPAGDAPAAEIVVAPGARRRGSGSALLAGVRAAAEAPPLFWAHGFLDPARAFAAAHRLSVRRELWRMSVTAADLAATVGDDPADVPLPEGFRLRTFTPAYGEAWLAVNAAAFADHPEQGRLGPADLRARTEQPWFDPAGFLLVEDVRDERAPRLAAFHWTKIEEGLGEVYVVGVDPAYQGSGLGGAVTRAGLAHLRSRGVPEVDLYVDGDNAAAIATYRRQGFERVALDVQLG
ncbi:mycothiol synthase [Agilicoccus flavus]|uniref:mycothiol synthase n=1 Tax=Agilicoccus flavus TaxID=2775968 RepID=UPI001CF70B3D|nr:mycothiol synthase [Agilicoccus flavus]